MIKNYLALYSSDPPKWDDITSLAKTLGFLDMTGSSTADYFQSNGVSAQFVNEVIEAATRVNYGQVSTCVCSTALATRHADLPCRTLTKSTRWKAHVPWLRTEQHKSEAGTSRYLKTS